MCEEREEEGKRGEETGDEKVVRVPAGVAEDPWGCLTAAASPSGAVNPAWCSLGLGGAPAGEGVSSATSRRASQPLGNPGCPC